jgi:glycine/D-amino acid oxidase-like deaminating enzyme
VNLQQKPYWWVTARLEAEEPAAPVPERADVAVLGAGYTGLAAARELARRGARVVVLEAETAGWGASSRNGGMVLTGMKLGVVELRAKLGRDLTAEMYRASMESIDCVEQIVREERIDCDFSRCGHLEVASKPGHYRRFAEWAETIARDFGRQVRLVPKEEMRCEIGSTIYYGGLVDEASAGLNPAKYVTGLASAAKRAGAAICEYAPVECVERSVEGGTPGFRVTTPRGIVRTREVLVATSGYTGAATPALRRRIVPIGSYIIATEPLPAGLAAELVPHGRMIFDSKYFLHYFRLTPDGRMLFGGRAAFFPEAPETIRRSAEILRRDMVRVYPQLAAAPVAYAWGGTLDFAFDLLPHAGKLESLHFAMGYAGHGVAMATYLGAKMAGVILGDKVALPFAQIAFPTAPLGLYNGRPWFLPLASLWYRLLDIIQ